MTKTFRGLTFDEGTSGYTNHRCWYNEKHNIYLSFNVRDGWTWDGGGIVITGVRSWEELTLRVSQDYHDLEQKMAALFADMGVISFTPERGDT